MLHNTDRQTFIQKIRREYRVSVPLLVLGAVAMAGVPLFLGISVIGGLGAALLVGLFGYGLVQAYRVSRVSDEELLLEAAKRRAGTYVLLALGMVLFGMGTGSASDSVLWVAIILLTLHGNEGRVAQARMFSANSAEKMSLARS